MLRPSPAIGPSALCQCLSMGLSLVEAKEGFMVELACPKVPPRELSILFKWSLPPAGDGDCVDDMASVICLLLFDPVRGERHFCFLEVFPEVCEHAEEREFRDELEPLSLWEFLGGLGWLFLLCWRPCGLRCCKRYAFPSLNAILSLQNFCSLFAIGSFTTRSICSLMCSSCSLKVEMSLKGSSIVYTSSISFSRTAVLFRYSSVSKRIIVLVHCWRLFSQRFLECGV